MAGSIPDAWGSLSILTSLGLSNNQLTGELPGSLVGLPSLERLNFHTNQSLCAPVDDAFQTWLQGIETVQGSSCASVDSTEDRAVLAELYQATNGDSWKDGSNWLSKRPVRDWHGVTNDANGRVTGLYLSYNQMSGEIPPGLGAPV